MASPSTMHKSMAINATTCCRMCVQQCGLWNDNVLHVRARIFNAAFTGSMTLNNRVLVRCNWIAVKFAMKYICTCSFGCIWVATPLVSDFLSAPLRWDIYTLYSWKSCANMSPSMRTFIRTHTQSVKNPGELVQVHFATYLLFSCSQA